MKERALFYYHHGYNCSQCILKAIESEYDIAVSKQAFSMCQAVNTGFGIGGMCSVLIAGIMAFGLLFDEATAKRLRIQLLDKFFETHKDLNCATLVAARKTRGNCDFIVGEIAEMIGQLIDTEKR